MTQQAQPHPSFPYGPDHRPWSELLISSQLGDGDLQLVTEPIEDPKNEYPVEPGFDFNNFQIPFQGLTAHQRKRALNQLENYLVDKRDHMVGFQANQDMDRCQQDLARLMDFHINNIGDPFKLGNYKPHSKIFEQAVLDYCAWLWRADWPHDVNGGNGEKYWGYVLTMGSTEGNLYGLYNARDYLSGKKLIPKPEQITDEAEALYVQAPLPENLPEDNLQQRRKNAYHPVVFYSQDTHYSIVKAVRTLGIDTFGALGNSRPEYQGKCPLNTEQWPLEVPSKDGADGPGEIDVDALVKLVDFFAGHGHPIILLLNFGTTFKGAYDNVRQVCERVYPILEKNGLLDREMSFEPGKPDRRRGFWIHVDGALGAGYMPFLRIAAEDRELRKELRRETNRGLPEFDFSLQVNGMNMVSSMVMSGHKWPGSPWPCGVFMTRHKYRLDPPSIPDYTGTPDTTFAGSRNGLSAVVLWNVLAQRSTRQHARAAMSALRATSYLESSLLELEDKLRDEGKLPEGGLYVERSPLALTVRFRQPNEEIVRKWSLSCQQMKMNDGSTRRYAHIFAMQSLTEDRIDAFIDELAQRGAFDEVRPRAAPPAAESLAEGVQPLVAVPVAGRGFQ